MLQPQIETNTPQRKMPVCQKPVASKREVERQGLHNAAEDPNATLEAHSYSHK